jgi:hypothetical protein
MISLRIQISASLCADIVRCGHGDSVDCHRDGTKDSSISLFSLNSYSQIQGDRKIRFVSETSSVDFWILCGSTQSLRSTVPLSLVAQQLGGHQTQPHAAGPFTTKTRALLLSPDLTNKHLQTSPNRCRIYPVPFYSHAARRPVYHARHGLRNQACVRSRTAFP